jgi:hypothetical protein
LTTIEIIHSTIRCSRTRFDQRSCGINPLHKISDQ